MQDSASQVWLTLTVEQNGRSAIVSKELQGDLQLALRRGAELASRGNGKKGGKDGELHVVVGSGLDLGFCFRRVLNFMRRFVV